MSAAKPCAVVTGANGFVGSHLVEHLLQLGYRVKCIARKSSNLQWIKDLSVEMAYCGLGSVDDLTAVFADADYVFHIAGVVTAPNEAGYMHGNVDTTRNVLDAAAHCPNIKRVLITSSLAAAGPATPGIELNETLAPAPITAYGRSKMAQEALCQNYKGRVAYTIVRPPAVYGPRDSDIFIFFKTVNSGLVPMLGFDHKTMSLVHVLDLVRGMEQAVRSDKAKDEIYFLGSTQSYHWEEIGSLTKRVLGKRAIRIRVPHAIVHGVAGIAEFIGKIRGKTPTLNREKANEITQQSWYCSSDKAVRDFGYQQKWSLEQGIQETINWYKANGWL
jgi:nucleoside-diphosphate-sugar epimerase